MKRLALAILILTGTAALWWTGAADRWLHPARHRTSGNTLAPLDAYAAAADGALTADERIARITLPDGDGPVIVAAERGSIVYLDPPSARVLETVPGTLPPEPEVRRPLGAPALSPAAAARAAGVFARGAPLRTIDWPGERNPDWTVRFVGRLGAATIKVADDVGTATPARGRPGIVDAEDIVPALIAGGGIILAALVLFWPKRKGRKLGRKR